MTLPATDNFNRAAIGANWSQGPGSALEIANNTYCRASQSWANCSMYWSADTPGADQYAQVQGLTFVGGNGPGPTVRHSVSDFVVLNANAANWTLAWYNGGSFTQIGSTYGTAPAANDIGKVTAVGSSFKGYVNTVERISGSNGSAPASGNGGLYSMTNSDGMDNFEVGNMGPAPTLEQEGFRWRRDDGNEADATPAAAQDANLTAPYGTNKRLRVLINATGDPGSSQFRLQYREVGSTPWRDID